MNSNRKLDGILRELNALEAFKPRSPLAPARVILGWLFTIILIVGLGWLVAMSIGFSYLDHHVGTGVGHPREFKHRADEFMWTSWIGATLCMAGVIVAIRRRGSSCWRNVV